MSPICFPAVEMREHFCRETTIENDPFTKSETLLSNSLLKRQSFQGYRWESLESSFTVSFNQKKKCWPTYIIYGLTF